MITYSVLGHSYFCDNWRSLDLFEVQTMQINLCVHTSWKPMPTCDSAHSWSVNSTATLEDQAAGTMTWYPTQSHYHYTEPTVGLTPDLPQEKPALYRFGHRTQYVSVVLVYL